MHKQSTSSVLLTSFLLATVFFGFSSAEEPMKLECNIGPIEKSFGRSNWLVYSCNDEDSLVVVSAKGNPAMPFYFFIGRRDGTRSLRGEGNASKESTSAAFEELSALVKLEASVQELLRATKDVEAP